MVPPLGTAVRPHPHAVAPFGTQVAKGLGFASFSRVGASPRRSFQAARRGRVERKRDGAASGVERRRDGDASVVERRRDGDASAPRGTDRGAKAPGFRGERRVERRPPAVPDDARRTDARPPDDRRVARQNPGAFAPRSVPRDADASRRASARRPPRPRRASARRPPRPRRAAWKLPRCDAPTRQNDAKPGLLTTCVPNGAVPGERASSSLDGGVEPHRSPSFPVRSTTREVVQALSPGTGERARGSAVWGPTPPFVTHRNPLARGRRDRIRSSEGSAPLSRLGPFTGHKRFAATPTFSRRALSSPE